MSNKGIWIVFEGPDGSGKSTVMDAVAKALPSLLPNTEILTTRHPGSTPLGKHIRDLVKYPDKYGVTIDTFSSQMLMFVDHVNFKNTVLLPAIERGAIVLGDRCDLISGLVYGMATGLSQAQLNTLIAMAAGPPIDGLYILTCPQEVLDKRLSDRGKGDRFETKENGLRDRVTSEYQKIMTKSVDRTVLLNKIVPLYNIKYHSTTGDVDTLVAEIAADINMRYLQSQTG